MSVALIQGASRESGIGLALAANLLAHTSSHVVVTARNPDHAHRSLAAVLAARHPAVATSSLADRVTFLSLDVTDEASIARAADDFKARCTTNDAKTPLRLLFNMAALLNPEKSLSQVSQQGLLDHLAVNTVGPVLVAKHFAPFFQRKAPAGGDPRALESVLANPILANLSARTGSIGDNNLGGWFSYRISKAGLNQATRTIGVELARKGIVTVALHPGTVDTDLSRPHIKNVKHDILSADESAAKLWDVVKKLKQENSGGFFDQNGVTIPF
ncbi:hypothetical protein DFJ73DRAFT_622266 [Zopfochytrium polystomum]|nr:hypothetical protein DFJ73DRAFT_622266 [Zopfochytrium polystomum]